MGNFDLGASEDAFEESNGTPALNQPFLGPAKLTSVEKQGYSDGQYPVIEFNFLCLGNNEVPGFDFDGERTHVHPEFAFEREDFQVQEGDDITGAQKQADRIAWILSYFMEEEVARQAVNLEGASSVDEAWEQLRSQVVSAFEQHGDTDLKVKIKVKAEVYNGDDQIQTPYYKGWIEGENSDNSLAWSNQDQQDAKQWSRAQDVSPESNGEMEPAGEDDWDW